MEYYAHSENSRNEKHVLSEHLLQTAKFAESFACREDYKIEVNKENLPSGIEIKE